MKREDLYRNRAAGGKPRPRSSRSSGREEETDRFYPFCHFLQVAGAVLALLAITGSHLLFPENISLKLQAVVKQEVQTTIQLPDQDWSGSLKELLLSRE